MSEWNWLEALSTQDLASIVVAVITVLGGIGIAKMDRARRRRKQDGNDDPPQATDSVTAVYDPTGVRTVQQVVNHLTNISDRLKQAEETLVEVEAELSKFRRSYLALYEWSQRIIYNWSSMRKEEEPPDLPPDIHHP